VTAVSQGQGLRWSLRPVAGALGKKAATCFARSCVTSEILNSISLKTLSYKWLASCSTHDPAERWGVPERNRRWFLNAVEGGP
jgi:hypothetical protein